MLLVCDLFQLVCLFLFVMSVDSSGWRTHEVAGVCQRVVRVCNTRVRCVYGCLCVCVAPIVSQVCNATCGKPVVASAPRICVFSGCVIVLCCCICYVSVVFCAVMFVGCVRRERSGAFHYICCIITIIQQHHTWSASSAWPVHSSFSPYIIFLHHHQSPYIRSNRKFGAQEDVQIC